MKRMVNSLKNEKVLFFLILTIGILASCIMLGEVPGGVNQDEAYAGYEAYSILHYGIDSHGYTNPVYFVSWGSGMNVLYSYLSIPFIALFGLNAFSIRIVQAAASVISMIFVYKLVKKINGPEYALWAMFFLAVFPWRILMSRWGLESNLAPAFLAAAWYFMILSIDKSRYLIMTFVLYGFSLYCYAVLWIFVPIMLAGQILWLAVYKKIRLNWHFFTAAGILVIMSLPLLLFLLVQYGVIRELRTSVISIPLLPGFRAGEFGFAHFGDNLKILFRLLSSQDDGMLWNSDGRFGIYYHISKFFIAAGSFVLISRLFVSIKKRSFDLHMFYAVNLCAAILFGALICDVNVNRINVIHILMIILAALGAGWIIENLRKQYIRYMIGVCYVALFCSFIWYYFTDYSVQIADCFQKDLGDAVKYAEVVSDKDIVLSNDINYAKYLFYSRYPADRYADSVKYINYPNEWLSVDLFGGGYFLDEVNEENIDLSKKYVWKTADKELFIKYGFCIEEFGDWIVAYRNE